MRYHYKKQSQYSCEHGATHICNHPIYNSCTLYKSNSKGLAVIQQRFDKRLKTTWWGEIDIWLVDEIFNNPNFEEYFKDRAGKSQDDIYPTVTIRQIMWALKMKPLPKPNWETVFDRREI